MGDGRCRVCNTQFASRIQLLAHLAGRKTTRTACSRQLWLSGWPGLSEAELTALDKKDAENKRKLRAKGRAIKTSDKPAHKKGPSDWVWIYGPIREVRPQPLKI